MAKSITKSGGGKLQKPAKPYAEYPLFAHGSGRWARKYRVGPRGRPCLRYYGRWAHTVGGKLVKVANIEASAAEAKAEFDRCWEFHSKGEDAPDQNAGTDTAIDTDDPRWTLADLCNLFLEEKHAKAEGGERSMHTVAEYLRTTDTLIAHFGASKIVDDITPADFAALRLKFTKGPNGKRCNAVTLRSKIRRARVVFGWGAKNAGPKGEMRPAHFGTGFDIPEERLITDARNKAVERMFEADELRLILDYLEGKEVTVAGKSVKSPRDDVMRAVVLLGCNAAFGNTDISSVPKSAIDLDKGWLRFPRPKTAVMRYVPLWPETVEALRRAIAQRPAAVDAADDDLVFLTARGTRYVRVQESKTTADRFVTINALARRFDLILAALKLNTRKGRGFYTLRHVFETIGGDAKDQVAVDRIMGHHGGTMAENYRQRIADERLLNVVNTVRAWLFGESST